MVPSQNLSRRMQYPILAGAIHFSETEHVCLLWSTIRAAQALTGRSVAVHSVSSPRTTKPDRTRNRNRALSPPSPPLGGKSPSTGPPPKLSRPTRGSSILNECLRQEKREPVPEIPRAIHSVFHEDFISIGEWRYWPQIWRWIGKLRMSIFLSGHECASCTLQRIDT